MVLQVMELNVLVKLVIRQIVKIKRGTHSELLLLRRYELTSEYSDKLVAENLKKVENLTNN